MIDCDEDDMGYSATDAAAPYDGLRAVTKIVQLTTGGNLRGWRLLLECGHGVEVVATGPDAAAVAPARPRRWRCAVCSS